MSTEHHTFPAGAGRDIFATTCWTVVVAAGQQHSAEAEVALESLCQTYWFPLYSYIRRRGHSKEDAEDLTQAFFSRFLAKNYLRGLDGERGRFRAFLLGALKHFLANERDKARCQKRGGNATHYSLDWQSADTKYELAAAAGQCPDKIFDREWAIALLSKVIRRLGAECTQANRAEQFEELRIFLTAGKREVSYAASAIALGMEEGAVRIAVHRLRKRYRELLRDEIVQTLVDPTQADEEMRSLFQALID